MLSKLDTCWQDRVLSAMHRLAVVPQSLLRETDLAFRTSWRVQPKRSGINVGCFWLGEGLERRTDSWSFLDLESHEL
jgi:hypothetical protein